MHFNAHSGLAGHRSITALHGHASLMEAPGPNPTSPPGLGGMARFFLLSTHPPGAPPPPPGLRGGRKCRSVQDGPGRLKEGFKVARWPPRWPMLLQDASR
eukprot:8176690-Pyramimonas_sp.AAC.1